MNNMKHKKALAIAAAAMLATTLALVGCGESQQSSANSALDTTSSTATENTSVTKSGNTTSNSTAATDGTQTEASGADVATTNSTGAASESVAAQSNTTATQDSNANIGEEAAKATALAHAGVSEANCTEMQVKLDADDAIAHYDVEFKSGGMEYDYDIDPATGDVIGYGSEVDD